MSNIIPFKSAYGAPDSSIDWCEPNFMYSPYVAEPMNTVSNLSFVIFGLIGASHEISQRSKPAYVLMHLTISLIGLGSMAFHATLRVFGQQSDELPMVYYLLFYLYQINQDKFATPCKRNMVIAGLLTYAMIFSVVHVTLKTTTAFQVHFVSLIAVLVAQTYDRFRTTHLEEETKKLVRAFFCFGLSAGTMWMVDYHGCTYFMNDDSLFNPHGHVWWHILMGYCAYYSIVMLKTLDESEKQKPYVIKYDNLFRLPMTFRSVQANDDLEAQTCLESTASSPSEDTSNEQIMTRPRTKSEQVTV